MEKHRLLDQLNSLEREILERLSNIEKRIQNLAALGPHTRKDVTDSTRVYKSRGGEKIGWDF